MKFSIVLSIIVAICISIVFAEDIAPAAVEKKTDKRGIYSGFGYGGHGYYGPSVVSHGYSIGHYGGHYPGQYYGYYPGYYGGHGYGHGHGHGHGFGDGFGYGGFGHHF